jgi:superfamily II DNA or RNA helicase
MIDKDKNYNTSFSASDLREYLMETGRIHVDPILDYEMIKDSKNKKVFDWQQEALNKLAHVRFGLCVAPCGSGKTLLMQSLICEDVYVSEKLGENRKQLIVVPETAHADNFIDNFTLNYKIKNKKRVAHWSSPKNFSSEDNISKTKALKEWLLADYKRHRGEVVKESVAVTTYASLNIVWSQLTYKEKLKAAKNLTVLIDECHHVKNLHSGDTPEEDMTMIAVFLKFLKDNAEELNARILGFTATPYRGDHVAMFAKEIYEQFINYQLDFVRHFLTLGIENLDILHEFFDKDPIEKVGFNIEKDPNPFAKHYIVVPPDCQNWNGNWRNLDRYLQRLKNRIILALMKNKGYSRKEAEGRILDLVTKRTQSNNKKLLRSEPKFGEPIENSKFDVVITCKLGREGTDWCVCNRVHNTSPEKSEPLGVQTFGRSIRRFEDKNHVIQYYYMKKFIEPKPGMTRAELIADKVHYLLITMLMDETMRPILLPKIPEARTKKSTKSSSTNSDHVSMRDVFGEDWDEIKEKVINHFSLNVVNEESVDAYIDFVISKYEPKPLASIDDIRDGLKLFVLKCTSSKIRNEYLSIEFIRKNAGFNKLVEEGETFIYKLEKNDFKTFSVFKEDVEILPNEEFSLLCMELPKIKAKELNKKLDLLSKKERKSSYDEFYDFKNAARAIVENNRKCTFVSIAKSLGVSAKVIENRIRSYNEIFKKMGKDQIIF